MPGPFKKNGTPDMRFAANKGGGGGGGGGSGGMRGGGPGPAPRRRDGGLDMRYAVNKQASPGTPRASPGSNRSLPSREPAAPNPGPRRRDGGLDMRYAVNKHASPGTSRGSPRVNPSPPSAPGPRRRDGGLDMRYGINKRASPETPRASAKGNRSPSSRGTPDQAPSPRRRDGGLDMRYSVNKQASSDTPRGSPNRSPPSRETANQAPGPRRKDGGLDMRYGINKYASPETSGASPDGNRSSASGKAPDPTSGVASGPRRKDGNLDMRYGINKKASPETPRTSSMGDNSQPPRKECPPPGPVKKNGTPDWRYRANREECPSPHEGSKRNDGKSDMRYNKNWQGSRNQNAYDPSVLKQRADVAAARSNTGSAPELPRKEDGSPDMRFRVCRDYLQEHPEEQPHNSMQQYWEGRQQDEEFMDAVRQLAEEQSFGFLNEYSYEDDRASVDTRDYYQPGGSPQKDDLSGGEYQKREKPQKDDISSGEYHKEKMPQREDNSSGQYPPSDRLNIPEYTKADIEALMANGKKIGNGSFGEVFLCELEGQKCAVKLFKTVSLNKPAKRNFLRELRAMEKLKECKQVVDVFGYCTDPVAIVMEYLPLGSMSYLLYDDEDPDHEAHLALGSCKHRLAFDVARAMQELHRQKIGHLDLKPENVLVTNDFGAKVSDFGTAYLRGRTTTQTVSNWQEGANENVFVGTLAYMAPERWDAEGAKAMARSFDALAKADSYSFGVLLNELLVEEEPYTELMMTGCDERTFKDSIIDGQRPRLAENIPSQLKTLIQNCWSTTPATRPTFEEIVSRLQQPRLFPDSVSPNP